MKKVNKYIIVSAALAVLIVTFAVLLILYDKRVFDISFIKRPDETTAAETSAPETSAPDTDTDTEPADTTGENTEPADTSGDDTEVPKSVLTSCTKNIRRYLAKRLIRRRRRTARARRFTGLTVCRCRR